MSPLSAYLAALDALAILTEAARRGEVGARDSLQHLADEAQYGANLAAKQPKPHYDLSAYLPRKAK